MNVTISLEHRFDRTPDGAVWTQTMFAHPFWTRYLEVFDSVRVLARVRPVREVPGDWIRADGEQVSFMPIPYYMGPSQYLKRYLQVRRTARRAASTSEAVIMRVGSTIADSIEPVLRKESHPFGVEVVGDPYDVFAPGSIRHPLRPFFRWWFAERLRQQCFNGCAAAYVTEKALQRRYPPPARGFSTYYSSVELPSHSFASFPRSAEASQRGLRLITVGTLNQLYKAPHILIMAVGECVRNGSDIELVLVGDGKHRAELEGLAASEGIGGRVHFKGQLPSGEAVRRELDQSDLFVLPSYQEGLPRAMIEAMARALPCIGSTVGGIPELLAPEDMVPPGDVKALANKIKQVTLNPSRIAAMSRRNLQKSMEYREDNLRERRVAFYRYISDITQEWLQQRSN